MTRRRSNPPEDCDRPDQNHPTPRPEQARTDRARAPIALPHVVITVAEPGTLNVTFDGRPFPVADGVEPWTRSTFAGLLDVLTQDRRVPIRLEIHETNGTTFTDIIPTRPDTAPGHAPPTSPASEPPQVTGRPAQAPAGLVDIEGSGFIAGEEVAVAAVVAETAAGPDGTCQLRIESSLLRGAHEVVLIGRVSRAAVNRRLS